MSITIRLGNFVNNVLTPTKLCCRYYPQQQLVVKSGGEFSAVRESPAVHKLGLCLHQYDCRYGEGCKFAHGQAELQLWKGVTQCMCRHFCMLAYTYMCMYIYFCVWGGVCEGVTLIYIAIYSPCLLDALGGMTRLQGMK